MKCKWTEVICCLEVESGEEVTIFYSHQYLRANQERAGKIVIKPVKRFERYLKQKDNEIRSFELNLEKSKSPDSDDQYRTSGSSQRLTSEDTSSQISSQISDQNATITAAPDDTALSDFLDRLDHDDREIEFEFQNSFAPNPTQRDQETLPDELLEEPSSGTVRSQPLETEQNGHRRAKKRAEFGYIKLDGASKSVEIFTETRSQKYYFEKKADNEDLFEKFWMANDKDGRAIQFEEIFNTKFDLFQIIRENKGGQLVFIPIEEVLDARQLINVASNWKNAMGKDVKVPIPDPLCVIIFDRSKPRKYLGKFNSIYLTFLKFISGRGLCCIDFTHPKDPRPLPDNKTYKLVKKGNFIKYKCLYGTECINEHLQTHAFKFTSIKGKYYIVSRDDLVSHSYRSQFN